MHQPLIKFSALYNAWLNYAPFRVLLTYEGWTENENRSLKWWELSYDGTPNGTVQCNHGRLGSKGRKTPFSYDFWKASDKVLEKLREGYVYGPGTSDAMPSGPTTFLKGTSLSNLPSPFCDVVSVQQAYDKDLESHVWHAKDAAGVLVATLNESGAMKLHAMLLEVA